MKISAVVLTRNEEKNVERCLNSLDFCDEIIIIDDFSTDDTLKRTRNAKTFQRKLNNDFASQRNFGLNKAVNDWVLFIDADEEVSKNLKLEIKNLKFNHDAYYVKRRDYFWDQELKFGEVKQIRENGLIRLIRKNSGTWMGSVHEVFITNKKKAGRLKGFINHYPHQTLKEFINEINHYSSMRAEELYNTGNKTNAFEIILFPFGKFIYNYFFNLGFMDGAVGFTYSFMMSFHSFLVRAKLYQLTNKK